MSKFSLTLSKAITLRAWKQLFRDKRTMGLVFIAPTFYVFVFGFGFAGSIEQIPIKVVNLDSQGLRVLPIPPYLAELNFGADFTYNMTVDVRVDVTELNKTTNATTNDFLIGKQEVLDKKYVAVILIPENYSQNLLDAFTSPDIKTNISIFLDNSNPQVGGTVFQAVQSAFQGAIQDLQSGISINLEYGYGEGLSTLEFFSPVTIGLGVFFFSFILAMLNLIEERKTGTLDLLLQSPYDKSQIILGYLTAFSVIATIQATIIIGVAGFLFSINYGTQLPSLYIAAIALSFSGLLLSILLSTFAKTEIQAVQFIPLVLFPAFFLCGIFIPLESIPGYFRWLSDFIPLTHGIALLRSIIIEGRPLDIFSYNFLALLAFLIFFFGIARFSLREA